MPALSLPKTEVIVSTVQTMIDIIIILKNVPVNVLMNVNALQISSGDLILIALVFVASLQFAPEINTLIRKIVDVSHSQHVVAAHSAEVKVVGDTLEVVEVVEVEVIQEVVGDTQVEVAEVVEDIQEVEGDTLEVAEDTQVEVIILEVKLLAVQSLLKITTMVITQYLVEEVEESD